MRNAAQRAQSYRVRAEELRTIRESWENDSTKRMLDTIVADYERMAEFMERQIPYEDGAKTEH